MRVGPPLAAMAAAIALAGCAGGGAPVAPRPAVAPPVRTFDVRELDTAGARVWRVDRLRGAVGIDVAREIAAELRRLGARARALEAGEAPDPADAADAADFGDAGQDTLAPLEVTGRILAVDGGSRVARTLLPVATRWGAARCRIEVRADGTRLVQESRAPRTAWAEPGAPVAERCLTVAAIEAARRLWRGPKDE